MFVRMCISSLLLRQLLLKNGDSLLKLFVFGLEVIDVSFIGSAKTLLDKVNGILWLFGLLIKTD